MRGKKPFLYLTPPPNPLTAHIFNRILLNDPNVQEREMHNDRQRAPSLVCVLFRVSPIYHLLVSHWANTSWQEASLGERKQAPLRLLCVCVLVGCSVLTRTGRGRVVGPSIDRRCALVSTCLLRNPLSSASRPPLTTERQLRFSNTNSIFQF